MLVISYPIVVAMASHVLMGFVDFVMVSRFGLNEFAAIGPAGVCVFTLLVFVLATANCNSAFVSQSLGRGTLSECGRYTWQGVYFGLIAQAAILPAAFLAPQFFGMFGHGPRLESLEATYFQIRIAHVAGTAIYAAMSSFFVGIGRPKVPMVAAVAANLFNVLANYVLIFGKFGFPALGLGGAALGTTISCYLQAALLLAVFLSRSYEKQFQTRSARGFDLARFKGLMKVGMPAGISATLELASYALFITWIIGGLGRAALAASNVVSVIRRVSVVPTMGIGKGVTALVGQHIGKGDIPGAKRRAYAGLLFTMACLTVIGVCFCIFRRPLVGIFATNFAADAEIANSASLLMMVVALLLWVSGFWVISQGALRGAGDTRVPAAISIACSWFVFLPLCYLLTRACGLGALGAWLAAATNSALIGAVLFWRFAGGAWRKIDIFEQGPK